jgi:hypothetical protein
MMGWEAPAPSRASFTEVQYIPDPAGTSLEASQEPVESAPTDTYRHLDEGTWIAATPGRVWLVVTRKDRAGLVVGWRAAWYHQSAWHGGLDRRIQRGSGSDSN